MTGPGIHSEHGASSAYRWLECPGSVALSRGIPRKDTVFSKEGTAAHALGELAFKRVRPPETWLGDELEGVKVTEEMCEAVQVYLDHLNETIELDDVVRLEHRITLEKLNPPSPMFGTCDCLIYKRATKTLHVIDYKHGAGVPVDVKGNKQLRYYALGAMLSLADDEPVETVVATIVQPRAPHQDGPVRSESFSSGELLDYAADLLDAVELSLRPDAPLKAGGHCKFCPASARCPARHAQAQEIAQVEFSAMPELAAPDPRLLPVEKVGELLTKVDLLKDWIKSLEDHAREQLEKGVAVPGWKLVQKRAIRRWAHEESTVVERLLQQGVEREALFEEPSLRSPAQIEKLLGKKRFPSDLAVAVSSGLTIAPEHDKRPAAALDAADEFAALPGANE